MTNLNSQHTELPLEDLRRRATILDNLPVGILGADENGYILSISPQANNLLGATGPALKGKNIFDLIAPDDRMAFECFFRDTLRTDSRDISGCSVPLSVNEELLQFAVSLQSAVTTSGTITVIVCLMPICKRLEGGDLSRLSRKQQK